MPSRSIKGFWGRINASANEFRSPVSQLAVFTATNMHEYLSADIFGAQSSYKIMMY
jgi:hypothetical protein